MKDEEPDGQPGTAEQRDEEPTKELDEQTGTSTAASAEQPDHELDEKVSELMVSKVGREVICLL